MLKHISANMPKFVAANLVGLAVDALYLQTHGILPPARDDDPLLFEEAARFIPGDDDAIKTVEREVIRQSLNHVLVCSGVMKSA